MWAFGLVIIGVTIYIMINWQGWTENFGDFFLVFVAFTSAINAIVTGALIDMHTMKRKRQDVIRI